MKLRALLELIRIPAVFTAPADVLMGAGVMAVLTGHPQLDAPTLLSAVVASALVYCAGMATNDLFDLKADLLARPERPLPSRRLSLREAWILVALAQTIAACTAWAIGWPSFVAVVATISLTYLYNSPLKALFIGPLLMGLCRVANGLIGASIVADPFRPDYAHLLMPVLSLTFAHVVLLTWIARFETHKRIPAVVKWFFVMQVLVCCLPPLLVIVFKAQLSLTWSAALGVIGALWMARSLGRLRGELDEMRVRGLVLRGIKGVAFLNASILFVFGHYLLGGIVLALLVPGRYVAKTFYAT